MVARGRGLRAFAVCGEVVRRFGEATEAALQEAVEKARRRKETAIAKKTKEAEGDKTGSDG